MSTLLCAICRESLGSFNNSCTLPCGHVFHDHCIFNWLERSQTCPHCRIQSRPDQVIKLYFDVAEDNQMTEVENLRREVNHLHDSFERSQNELKVKSEECNRLNNDLDSSLRLNDSLRKENKVLNSKVERLNTFKLDYGRQKTELKNTTTALHNEKIKNSQLSGELSLLRNVKILIDGTPDDASRVMDSEESMDFETLKKCFMIMKRDFGNSMKTEAKLKTDYSRLASFTKVLEKKNADLTEKCSIQHRIIEAYKSDLRSSTKRSLPVESSPPESTDDVETNLQPTPAKKVAPRRSPRNLIKRSTFPIECKVSTSRQLTYDGLGGHSEQDKFPAKLKPCRIVSNRRK